MGHKKYILLYECTPIQEDTLQDFAYVLGLKIVHDEEEGCYHVFINYGHDQQQEIACYADFESNEKNGYTYDEVCREVFTESFFSEHFNYPNLTLYKKMW